MNVPVAAAFTAACSRAFVFNLAGVAALLANLAMGKHMLMLKGAGCYD
jgi:hypothetical protein